jgi:hypothetical protein
VPFQAARLILLNGIEDVISLPDLADRALFLTLPPIADALRGNFRGRAASASRIVARGRCAWAAKPAGGHGMRNGMSLAEEPSGFADGCVVRRHSCGY